MSWTPILLAAAGCYALKLAGLSIPQRVLDGVRVQRVAILLPVALLAALIATQTFGEGIDARAAGLAAAVVALLLRAPFLVVVAVGRRDDRSATTRRVIRRAVGLPNLNEYAEPGRLVAPRPRRREARAGTAASSGITSPTATRRRPPPTRRSCSARSRPRRRRIRFGALLTPLARRRPTKVARETATLDLLSGGRLIFGAALGWSGEEEFEDLGEPGDARTRADKLDEALR